MRKIEALARKMHALAGYSPEDWRDDSAGQEDWIRLAIWHNRQLRKARGKTLGFVCVSLTGRFCQNAVHAHADRLWNDIGFQRARVVAHPPRKP